MTRFKVILIINGIRFGTGMYSEGQVYRYVAEIEDPQLVTDYVMTLIGESIARDETGILLGHYGETRKISWNLTPEDDEVAEFTSNKGI